MERSDCTKTYCPNKTEMQLSLATEFKGVRLGLHNQVESAMQSPVLFK